MQHQVGGCGRCFCRRASVQRDRRFQEEVRDDQVDVEGKIFNGLDAYKQAIDSGVDMVVIATPPGFKPQQFEYAINQGKKVFMEKPVAAGATGVNRVLASAKKLRKKGCR